MKKVWSFWVGQLRQPRLKYWLFAALALAWSCSLSLKPAHFDEGINGWFVARMWSQGFYNYNAEHFHGPLYFYLQQINELLFGPGLAQMRFLNVLFGLATVILIWAHSRWLGRAAEWAALLALVSPGFSFFSRYAIHEAPFIFFQILFSYCYWRFKERPSQPAFVGMALAWTGLLTLKETWIMFAGVWILAHICLRISRRFWPLADLESQIQGSNSAGPVAGVPTREFKGWVIVGSVAVTLFLFAGWGLDPSGAQKFLLSFLEWMRHGVGQTGHEKPWHYWIELASRYEPWLYAGMLGGLLTLAKVNRVIRFFAIFALGLFLAYSIVPYKTPWLILNFLWPATFLLGFLIERLFAFSRRTQKPVRKWATGIIVIGLFAWSGHKSWQLNFIHHSDPQERYVYVQTSQEWGDLWNAIVERGRQAPALRSSAILVSIKQSWPLPYLLVRYPNSLFTGLTQGLEGEGGPLRFSILILDGEDESLLGTRLTRQGYLRKKLILRDAMAPIVVLLRAADYANLALSVPGLEPY